NGRAKTLCLEFPAVRIYLRSSFYKLLPALVKMTIVIQVMDRNFMPPQANLFQEFGGNAIAFLRNDLKRGFDAVGVVDIHQRWTVIPADLRLDIVCHNSAPA